MRHEFSLNYLCVWPQYEISILGRFQCLVVSDKTEAGTWTKWKQAIEEVALGQGVDRIIAVVV